MPTITAFLHTENDALRVGRCLETLYACDEVVIIDHHSDDDTLRIAREYGAHIVSGAAPGSRYTGSGWIFCLETCESVSESLAASLYQLKSGHADSRVDATFSIFLREETKDGWINHASAQTRIVPASWTHWQGPLPINQQSSQVLEGELLRFAFP